MLAIGVMERQDYGIAFQQGYGATRRLLLSRGADIDSAEEIAQAAWARGWEYLDQLRDPDMVGYWVNSIARNLYRARFRLPQAGPLDGVEPPYNMNLHEIELNHLLDRCSARDQALLRKSLEGYSAEEIAREAGITSTGIRVRMLRIRNLLRERLEIAA